MKKIIKKVSLSLLVAPILFSCGSLGDVSMGIGDGNKENDSIRVDFTLPSSIKTDTKVSFKFYAEKDIEFAPSYFFSLFDVDPLFNESYKESVLISFDKEKLEILKQDNGNYGDYTVELLFSNLDNYFLKTDDKKDAYFVFHTSDWARGEITKYSSWHFKYTYSNDNVSLFDAYE